MLRAANISREEIKRQVKSINLPFFMPCSSCFQILSSKNLARYRNWNWKKSDRGVLLRIETGKRPCELTRISHGKYVKRNVTLLFINSLWSNFGVFERNTLFFRDISPSAALNLKWRAQRTKVRFRCHFIFALLRKKCLGEISGLSNSEQVLGKYSQLCKSECHWQSFCQENSVLQREISIHGFLKDYCRFEHPQNYFVVGIKQDTVICVNDITLALQ